MCLFTYLYQYYINHHYLRNIFFKKTFEKENPSQTLESYKFFTHNHLHRFSKISFTPTSLSTHPWEVLNPNTYLTHSECWEKFWCVWEALEEDIEWWMQFEANCGIRTISEDMTLWSSLIAGTWRVQVYLVD